MINYRAMPSGYYASGNYQENFGKSNTVAKIKGTVKKMGVNNNQALVVLFNKATLLPVLSARPDPAGNYKFIGMNKDDAFVVMAFDANKQFNAVIQDNVVPK
ncbi:hypothetical protein [Acinetobacter variabilis]|uniref:hypothetical protein n=1 Tax=Acinetobacter variabilis TaxID=70346 RepID=UPI00289FB39A|nr:hypothetical protein [Acinetobacter variabilis]